MVLTNIAVAVATATALFSGISNGFPSRALYTRSDSADNTTNCKKNSSSTDDLKFDFRKEKIKGVNAGGWFVLEPWITPSIFEATPDNVVDEFTFCQTLGKDEALKRLTEHWSTWLVESDFADMAKIGLNFVRIPIGYWSVSPIDGEPYVQGAYDYLGKALDWADTYGLKVMIDLHGAPGSQNGFDNSGKRGPVGWGKNDTIDQTYTALNKIRDDHASHPAVAAIELLNEPAGTFGVDKSTIEGFYTQGYNNLADSNVAVAIHDGFLGVDAWNDWAADKPRALMDTHHYEIFDVSSLLATPSDHVSVACKFGAKMAKNQMWTISGEWTGAITDCAKWLNGRGIGARWDGNYHPENGQAETIPIGSCDGLSTGTVKDLSDQNKENIKNFIAAQITAYEKADGWLFWSYKSEAAPEWHFKDLVAEGLIPLPLGSVDGCKDVVIPEEPEESTSS
ncbi:putative Exo-beta-1,3-glucanase [Teratosphaeria nubilosa]|uniref:glucan 1,3-beta-glucosidase n=1 Tax=Teratosphaeria nubilosa TaxID=161662 RepID=A0A6G1L2L5_9PEZI|nr:putative Exo-beta-1,3-glucanase [Teratosphaeria nubilosa]